MKLQRIFALALMMGFCTLSLPSFVACDSDNDDENIVEVGAAHTAQGDYEGSNAVVVEMKSKDGVLKLPQGTLKDFVVSIQPNGANKVNLKLDDYQIAIDNPRAPIKRVESKELLLKGVDATLNADGSINLQGDIAGQEVQMILESNGQTTEGPLFRKMTISKGQVKGSIAANGTLSLTVSFQPGTMPFPLVYNITAKRK